jgi:hypothetical protein
MLYSVMKGDLLKKKTLLALSADTLKVRSETGAPSPKHGMNKGCFSCVSLLTENSGRSFATGEVGCDGFYCTCMHRGRQDGLIVVFSLCEHEAVNTEYSA